MSLTGGKRKLSKWNKFVQKVYADQHRKNKNFQFKDALKMASAMKKKGQYGGNEGSVTTTDDVNVNMGEMDETDKMSDDVKMDNMMADVDMADAVDVDMTGGRRRRTMRRRRGRTMRGKRRTMRRSQRRGRGLRGGVVVF